jgi:hypothetical protein
MKFVVDPIAARLVPSYEPDSCLYEHDWTACPRRREKTPVTDRRLFMMVLAFADLKGARDDRETHTVTERRELAARIDDLHRRGAKWPMLPRCFGVPDTDWFPFAPPPRGATRVQSRRPAPGYCVRWNGAFWVPCRTQAERRGAGYVGLTMRWPGPKPAIRSFMWSGPRARHAYQVSEIERFDRPRGAGRYTCRIWCLRIAPSDVPKKAKPQAILWDPRRRLRRTVCR